jgi:hypothetical protein
MISSTNGTGGSGTGGIRDHRVAIDHHHHHQIVDNDDRRDPVDGPSDHRRVAIYGPVGRSVPVDDGVVRSTDQVEGTTCTPPIGPVRSAVTGPYVPHHHPIREPGDLLRNEIELAVLLCVRTQMEHATTIASALLPLMNLMARYFLVNDGAYYVRPYRRMSRKIIRLLETIADEAWHPTVVPMGDDSDSEPSDEQEQL